MLRQRGCGKKISVEERNGSKARRVEFDVGRAAWVRDCLSTVSKVDRPGGFWRRRRLETAIIFFQVLSNARGKYGLLSLEPFKGRKIRIFFPEGAKGKCWATLADEFIDSSRGWKDTKGLVQQQ